MERSNSGWWRIIIDMGLLMLLVLSCGVIMFFTLNMKCHNSLTQKLPIYPGAEVVWEAHNALTAFGVGQTYMILESPDDQTTVQDWYFSYTAELLRNRREDNRYYIGHGRWHVTAQEDGTGSQITLNSSCVQ